MSGELALASGWERLSALRARLGLRGAGDVVAVAAGVGAAR